MDHMPAQHRPAHGSPGGLGTLSRVARSCPGVAQYGACPEEGAQVGIPALGVLPCVSPRLAAICGPLSNGLLSLTAVARAVAVSLEEALAAAGGLS
jgi:hypothetical protein